MRVDEIIASGLLELYVCGALPANEAIEVENNINKYPIIKKEVEQIEASLLNLAVTVSPIIPESVWNNIAGRIRKVRSLNATSTNWGAITGWAAAILCIGGIFWMLNKNSNLQNSVEITTTENTVLQEKINSVESKLAESQEVLDILRAREYATFTLPGNEAVAPQAFAKVYYNQKEGIAYIDTKSLPEAPRGKVYQVWALKMQPLTPTSVGLLTSATEVEDKIYRFVDLPLPEAFGITLEPEGGSKTPTLDQLYILGATSTL